jgi:acyl-CoA thioesterase
MEEDKNLKHAKGVVAGDPMASFLGIQAEEVKRAYARLSLIIKEHHTNSLGRAHGMAISSLADQAVAVASNATEQGALVVELKINFLKAVSAGDKITAEASPISLGRQLSLWQVDIRDSTGNAVSVAQALAYHRL